MFRALFHLRPLNTSPVYLGGMLSIFKEKYDEVNPKFQTSLSNDVIHEESGWDRVKQMYLLNEYGYVSKELQSVIQTGFASAFVGVIWGGMNHSRTAFNNFMNNNQATAFQSNHDAKKKLQFEVSTAFGRGGMRLAWRFALFTTMFCAISTTVSVYRAKSSVWEYMIGGVLTGFIYRIPLGLRGSLVGGGVGLVLGTIAGVVTYSLLKVSGNTIEEVRFWQYQYEAARQKASEEVRSSREPTEVQPLIDQHSASVTNRGPGIPDEIK